MYIYQNKTKQTKPEMEKEWKWSIHPPERYEII